MRERERCGGGGGGGGRHTYTEEADNFFSDAKEGERGKRESRRG